MGEGQHPSNNNHSKPYSFRKSHMMQEQGKQNCHKGFGTCRRFGQSARLRFSNQDLMRGARYGLTNQME